jgi:hypothetical protein
MSFESYSQWQVGQKVLCVNGSFSGAVWDWCNEVPVAGEIYTIRALIISTNYYSGVGCLSFYLEEIINNMAPSLEHAFCSNRFRPLSETDCKAQYCEDVEPLIFTK